MNHATPLTEAPILQHRLTQLRALGQPTRLRIVALLQRQELSVSELTAIVGASQPSVSRHLRILTTAGLVEAHREGHHMFYRLPAGVAATIAPLLPIEDAQLCRDKTRLHDIETQRHNRALQYFETQAKHWDALRALHIPDSAIEAAIHRRLQGGWRKGRRYECLLDCGTGTGRMLEVFAPLAEEAFGVDISANMLSLARVKLAKPSLSHCVLRQSDVTALPFQDARADIIIVHQLLHFVPRPPDALAEIGRVLRPGGMVLVADFARHTLTDVCAAQAHYWAGFDKDDMLDWLRGAGLERCAFTPIKGEVAAKTRRPLQVCLWTGYKKGA